MCRFHCCPTVLAVCDGVISFSTGKAEVPNWVVPPLTDTLLKIVSKIETLNCTWIVVDERIGGRLEEDEIAIGAIILCRGLAWVLGDGVRVSVELQIFYFRIVVDILDTGSWGEGNLSACSVGDRGPGNHVHGTFLHVEFGVIGQFDGGGVREGDRGPGNILHQSSGAVDKPSLWWISC